MARVFVRAIGQTLKLKYLQVYQSRGRTYVYFRRHGEPRHQLDPDAPDFMREYASLLGERPPVHRRGAEGTIDDLVIAFRMSPEFQQRKAKTKAQYARHLDLLRNVAGSMPAVEMPPLFLYQLRDRFADTPAEANAFIRSVKRLYNWAKKRGYIASNPISDVELLPTQGGYRPWEEDEIEQFQEFWELGTLQRTMFDLQLWTAQRGSDVVRMKWSHMRDGIISVATQVKTGARVEIPVAMPLQRTLDAWRDRSTGDVILVGQRGRPFTRDRFTHLFNEARTLAGIANDKKGHGLRFTAARRLLDVGIHMDVIAMITGHRTSQMVQHYAYRRRETRFAFDALEEVEESRNRLKVSNIGEKCLTPEHDED